MQQSYPNRAAPRAAPPDFMQARLTALPEPDAEARAHAARVAAHLRDAIDDAGGCLPFDRFMDIALNAPGLGYYATGGGPGAGGDFVTAPELGSLFARCLARQAAEVLDEVGGSVLEFGAGSGALARQLLGALDAAGMLPDEYLVLETSVALRERQHREIDAMPARLAARVRWLDRLPEAPLAGVIIANEVLDAMPVTRFRVTSEGVEIAGVSAGADGFDWCAAEPGAHDDALAEIAARHGLPPGYQSEYNPRAAAWMRQLGGWLARGAAFIVDYGYPAAEYYHRERDSGTLTCFFRHVAHHDPLVLTGIQDITAHLDFTSLANAARSGGLDVLGYTSLAAFLVGSGLADELAAPAATPGAQLALANEIKRLTLPSEMGELFKVLVVGRGVARAPSAFARGDRSTLLGGAA